MCIEPIIEDDRWTAAGLEPLAGRAAAATLTHFGLDPAAFEIALLACDDARIAALNADFRGKPQPTNVLSWPETDLAAEVDGDAPLRPEAGASPRLMATHRCAPRRGRQGPTRDRATAFSAISPSPMTPAPARPPNRASRWAITSPT